MFHFPVFYFFVHFFPSTAHNITNSQSLHLSYLSLSVISVICQATTDDDTGLAWTTWTRDAGIIQ